MKKSAIVTLGLLVAMAPASALGATYTVRTGDTLSGIAGRHNTTVNKLVSLNNISNPNLIRAGQVLKVAEKQSTYIVKSGDTLSLIASRNNTTVNQLVSINNISNPDLIQVGQVLELPGDQSQPQEPQQPSQITYTVKAGDQLGLIAHKYQTTVSEIMRLNNLSNPDTLFVGQTLIIQGTPREIPDPYQDATHTVVAGDTLSALASRYNTTVARLADLNNLSSPYIIRVGQQLVVGSERGSGAVAAHWDYVNVEFPIGTTAKVTDIATGISYNVVRLSGYLHTDVEPATAADTAKMHQIYNYQWSWAFRPVVVEVNGHRFAASINGMPHDIQSIYNNNFPGHSCIHFLGSKNHFNQQEEPGHQANVQKAIGK
ncbi:MAG: LysM peptidoglycan-binding domain-containing protein [Firmicutes bacterium]|nr:LysM peptidoglycan-binding domain-containing protein [Bacillota bacterium]